jgi:hypothetical protein
MRFVQFLDMYVRILDIHVRIPAKVSSFVQILDIRLFVSLAVLVPALEQPDRDLLIPSLSFDVQLDPPCLG